MGDSVFLKSPRPVLNRSSVQKQGYLTPPYGFFGFFVDSGRFLAGRFLYLPVLHSAGALAPKSAR